MLTQTEVIRFIERRLGFTFTDLELTHDEILETIEMETLPLFSKYFPYQERSLLNTNNKVDGMLNQYYVDTETDIININRVIGLDLVNGTGAGLDAMFATPNSRSGGGGGGNVIENQIMADLRSHTNPVIFQFYYPNVIEIMPSYGKITNFTVMANVVHPSHFGTIPTNLRAEFLKLALYDVSESLYPLRHRFANLQTSFGSIELFLDQLQEATALKEELIEKMAVSALRNGKRKSIIIA